MTNYSIKGKWGDVDVDLLLKVEDTEAPGETETPKPTEPTDPPIDAPEKTVKTISAWRGETVWVEAHEFGAYAEVVWTKFYKFVPTETTKASFKGARTGTQYDALEPCDAFADADWVQIKVPADADGVHMMGETLAIEVEPHTIRPMLPFYMELESYKVLLAYFNEVGNNNDWAAQGRLTKQAIELYREFWIEPTKQNIQHYPLDLKASLWADDDYSYQAMTFDGALYKPLIWAGGKDAPSPGFLNALYDLHGSDGYMFYGIDEAGTGPSGLSKQDAFDRIEYLRRFSDADVMQTGVPWDAYAHYDNVLRCVPNVWSKDYPTAEGEYSSCMAQGNCGNTDNPNPRTDSPTMVLDSDFADWRNVVYQANKANRDFILYFNGTQRLPTCWEVDGLYNEGGQGDGTLVYFKDGRVIPSIRLVALHMALQEASKGIIKNGA